METDLSKGLRRIRAEGTYAAYSSVANLDFQAKCTALPRLGVAILRNYTIEPLVPVIKGEVIASGFAPDLYVADFDTIGEEVFNPKSALYSHGADFIIVSHWLDTFSPDLANSFAAFSEGKIELEFDRVIGQIHDFLLAIRRHTNAAILINNFPLPNSPVLGILDCQNERYQTYTTMRLNLELIRRASSVADVYWVDHMGLFSRIGWSQAFDARGWHFGRAPLGKDILVPLGQVYGRHIRALRGLSKKCLVLDCDNTLWKGVIGEDGFDGIAMGDSYPGSSFRAFQQAVLSLYHRGIILAICSKNNEPDVLQVLSSHPDSLLRPEHFATWQINWDDKATNLRRVAESLNIGVDSLVFVDDSKFECDWVRDQLPAVGVLNLSSDTYRRSVELLRCGFFDSLAFSLDDQKRNAGYAADARRRSIQGNSSSIEEYLAQLEIAAVIGRPSLRELPRIAQLTQKTNQFNLTTKRYTLGDIQRFDSTADCEVVCLKLSDSASDLGVIGTAVMNFRDECAEIDTFLLSCRALGRGADILMLSYLLKIASDRGVVEVRAKYRATSKNGQVAQFYPQNGFALVSNESDGSGADYTIFLKESFAPRYPSWILVTETSSMTNVEG